MIETKLQSGPLMKLVILELQDKLGYLLKVFDC
jgi:hypothetical protein